MQRWEIPFPVMALSTEAGNVFTLFHHFRFCDPRSAIRLINFWWIAYETTWPVDLKFIIVNEMLTRERMRKNDFQWNKKKKMFLQSKRVIISQFIIFIQFTFSPGNNLPICLTDERNLWEASRIFFTLSNHDETMVKLDENFLIERCIWHMQSASRWEKI